MRNFTPLCIFLLFFPCFWSGCDDRSVRHRMLEAEARFDTVPSDIFRLLSEVGSPDSLSSEDRALYDLLTLRSYSIGGEPLPDSLVRHVYAYYHATDDSLHRARASLYMSRLHYKSRSHFRQWLLPLLEAERYAPTDNLLLRGQISSDMGFMDCPFSRPAGRGESLVEMADVSVGSFRPGNLRQALRR